jgi:hypothetical protein
MKKCSFCGTRWQGFRGQPRPRELCDGCRRPLHCCANCHHFDRILGSACKLPHTAYVGHREVLNYCEDFQVLDSNLRANEDRVHRARTTWEELFKR